MYRLSRDIIFTDFVVAWNFHPQKLTINRVSSMLSNRHHLRKMSDPQKCNYKNPEICQSTKITYPENLYIYGSNCPVSQISCSITVYTAVILLW